MHYQLAKNINCTIYNDTAVFFDIYNDSYQFINLSECSLLERFLLSAPVCSSKLKTEFKKVKQEILYLNELGLLNCSEIVEKEGWRVSKISSTGVENADWRIKKEDILFQIDHSVIGDFINTYLTLIKIHILAKLGFYYVVNYVRRSKISHKKDHINNNQNIILQSVRILNLATFYFPCRVKCLEWSICLHIILTKKNQDSCIKIGVQNNPFISHAWVEEKGRMIADDPSLPKKLAILFNEC